MDSRKQVQISLIFSRRFYKEVDITDIKLTFCTLQKTIRFLTYGYDCVLLWHKQKAITSFIELPNNAPENYVLIDEGYISNYFGVDTKENPYRKFKWSQSNPMDKIFNHVRTSISVSLKSRETHYLQLLMNTDRSINETMLNWTGWIH